MINHIRCLKILMGLLWKTQRFLEFDIKQHLKLKKYCKIGIGYSISVWDVISAKEVIDHLNLDYVKIPSACKLNYDIHQILAKI